jgi:DNA topoisomerase I
METHLLYVDEKTPGIRRKKCGKGFTYLSPTGARVIDRVLISRVKKLAIPPAWRDVWIAPHPESHIQATGRDNLGRKQYIYHSVWQELRNQTKFDRMIEFGRTLSRIREQVERNLSTRKMSKERAVAFVIRLLDITRLRIGNPEYARLNNSYGLTTLLDEHVEVRGARIRFNFPGKGRKQIVLDIHDRRLAALAKKYQELPGQELVQYVDETGTFQTVGSADVNAFLKEITGEEFTAKDFRTWGGTVLTANELYSLGPAASRKEARKKVNLAIRTTARRLGNTPAICRRYYIHPVVIRAYEEGALFAAMAAAAETVSGPRGLDPGEIAVIALLERARIT